MIENGENMKKPLYLSNISFLTTKIYFYCKVIFIIFGLQMFFYILQMLIFYLLFPQCNWYIYGVYAPTIIFISTSMILTYKIVNIDKVS